MFTLITYNAIHPIVTMVWDFNFFFFLILKKKSNFPTIDTNYFCDFKKEVFVFKGESPVLSRSPTPFGAPALLRGRSHSQHFRVPKGKSCPDTFASFHKMET